jgi:GTP-binding protein EngB required for normal cell division
MSSWERSGLDVAEQPAPVTDLPSGLEAIRCLATEVGAAALAAEAAALAERLAEGRFFVACVGQFKRGKSTLLNALIGQPVLPVGVVPVTSAVTILRHGPVTGARVFFASGASITVAPADLAAYVAEEHNPENAKGVAVVEVSLPSPLLASGMCLVDTPGLGSVFAGNTAVTRQFLPHVDAALVVLGADPPISGDELALVEAVAKQTRALVVVLNKADRLSPPELAEARAFTARVLAGRLGRSVEPIFEVSAVERLSGSPTREWGALYQALEALAATSGADLLGQAHVRGLHRLVDALLREIDEQIGALARPQAESERRIELLRTCIEHAERSLRELGPLFKAEQERLARAFGEERDRFLEAAQIEAGCELDEAIGVLGAEGPGRLRERGAERAQEIARRRIEGWEREMEPVAERLYRSAMDRFVALGNDVLREIPISGEPALAALPRELPPEAGFRAKKRFQFHELLTLATPGFPARLLDVVRPQDALVRAVKKEAPKYLARLLETNAARVSNDLVERVLDSRRRLEAELLALLRDVAGSAERSLERARRTHAEGDEAVRGELGRLRLLRARAVALLPGFGRAGPPD